MTYIEDRGRRPCPREVVILLTLDRHLRHHKLKWLCTSNLKLTGDTQINCSKFLVEWTGNLKAHILNSCQKNCKPIMRVYCLISAISRCLICVMKFHSLIYHPLREAWGVSWLPQIQVADWEELHHIERSTRNAGWYSNCIRAMKLRGGFDPKFMHRRHQRRLIVKVCARWNLHSGLAVRNSNNFMVFSLPWMMYSPCQSWVNTPFSIIEAVINL